jgi:hypothetical protein
MPNHADATCNRPMSTRFNSPIDDQSEGATRLWRLRRRHNHIDAIVRPWRRQWQLEFVRNGRVLLTRTYVTREKASADAEARLRDLQRAGWNTHW